MFCPSKSTTMFCKDTMTLLSIFDRSPFAVGRRGGTFSPAMALIPPLLTTEQRRLMPPPAKVCYTETANGHGFSSIRKRQCAARQKMRAAHMFHYSRGGTSVNTFREEWEKMPSNSGRFRCFPVPAWLFILFLSNLSGFFKNSPGCFRFHDAGSWLFRVCRPLRQTASPPALPGFRKGSLPLRPQG